MLSVEAGASGIVLSNHGGRQLDFGRSGIEILPEVMDALRKIGAVDKIEVNQKYIIILIILIINRYFGFVMLLAYTYTQARSSSAISNVRPNNDK